MDGTITNQGFYISNGGAVYLPLRSGVSWVRTYNWTRIGTNNIGGAANVEAYWQTFMPNSTAIGYQKGAGTNAVNAYFLGAGTGFTTIDTSQPNTNPILANTAITMAATPVVTAGATTGLFNGATVLITRQTGAPQLGGIPFTIGNLNPGVSFELSYLPQLAAASTGGFFQQLPSQMYTPDENGALFLTPATKWTPSKRIIARVTLGFPTTITMTVTHNMVVGQQVRIFNTQTQLDGLSGNIVAVNPATNAILLDIDSTGFTQYTFPTAANWTGQIGEVLPFGEGPLQIQPGNNVLADSVYNNSTEGVLISGGILAPGGQNNDVIFWQSGTTFNQ